MSDGADWFSEETATFGDRLAGARQATGMSQGQLAKRLGVKLKTLRSWEDDLAEPRANRLQMLSGILGVSLTWLLSGEGEGLEEPADENELPKDVQSVLTELRQMKTEMRAGAERIGKLEKRLKRLLEETL